MKILVTGGAGFIGKYLVRYLLEKCHDVTIFDNFSNSTKDSISFLEDIGAKVIEGDITKLQDIINAGKKQEIVIHLAAKISVSESITNSSKTFEVNVDGTKNVLIACKKNNIKKFIAASSAAVYGEISPNVKLSEGNEKNPISPYGKSKLKMEQEIREFEEKNGINCIILRFFNIYGIGQTSEYSGVITKFLERIRLEKSLEIFGDGQQTRDFIAIEDIVNLICNTISNGKSGTYNIATGKSITIKNLAKQMILLSGKKLEIKFAPSKKGEIKYSQADISLAKKELGYSPKSKLKMIKELLE
jgi:UDP-glucose 4-epimerase